MPRLRDLPVKRMKLYAIKATCPACGDIVLSAHQVAMMIDPRDEGTNSFYVFRCPECGEERKKPANSQIIDMLMEPLSAAVPEQQFIRLPEPVLDATSSTTSQGGLPIIASCTNGSNVELKRGQIRLVVADDPRNSYYRFTCPGCLRTHTKPADQEVIRLLVMGGVKVERLASAGAAQPERAAAAASSDEPLTVIFACTTSGADITVPLTQTTLVRYSSNSTYAWPRLEHNCACGVKHSMPLDRQEVELYERHKVTAQLPYVDPEQLWRFTHPVYTGEPPLFDERIRLPKGGRAEEVHCPTCGPVMAHVNQLRLVCHTDRIELLYFCTQCGTCQTIRIGEVGLKYWEQLLTQPMQAKLSKLWPSLSAEALVEPPASDAA